MHWFLVIIRVISFHFGWKRPLRSPTQSFQFFTVMPKFAYEKSFHIHLFTERRKQQPSSNHAPVWVLGERDRRRQALRGVTSLKPPQADICETQEGRVWFNPQQSQSTKQGCLSWMLTKQIHVTLSFPDTKHIMAPWFFRVRVLHEEEWS